MALNSYGGPGSDEERTPNPMVFGTPMQPKAIDDGGGAVDPVLGAGAGGVNSPSAIPSMAEGGAIPDDDEESAIGSNAGVVDDETSQLNGALQMVQKALMYGRQKHGLPGGGGSSDDSTPQPDEGGIPSDDGEESYAEGGSIEDDIAASNNATDDGPQYGRPEVVDDPEAVSPPISGDNLDMSGHVGNESAGLNTANPAAAGDESAGLNTSTAPAPAQASGGIPSEYAPHNMLRNGVQSVLAYLQRKDAMPNGEAIALERSVAPAAKNDPAAVPVLATAAAGPPDKQFAYIQRNAAVYDAVMAHGRAALNGVEGRPPSLDIALQDATKAFSNVPDGENVHFVKHGDGVVAQVSGASGREQRGYPLTLEQFGQLLDTGKAGMFDRMMEPGGVRKVLGSFGQQQQQTDGAASNPYLQQRVAQQKGGIPTDDDAGRPGAMAAAAESDRNVTMGHDVTRLSASPQYKQQNPDWGKSPERVFTPEERRAMNPSKEDRAQGYKLEQIKAKNEGKPQRDYMGEIEAKDKAKLGQIDREQGYKTERANAGIGSREKMAADKLVEQAKSREASNGRNAASNSERLLASKLLSGQKLTPQEQARADQIVKGAQPQQQQAPQQQQPAVPPAEQREVGRTYTSPDGRQGVWTGKGWRLVQ